MVLLVFGYILSGVYEYSLAAVPMRVQQVSHCHVCIPFRACVMTVDWLYAHCPVIEDDSVLVFRSFYFEAFEKRIQLQPFSRSV